MKRLIGLILTGVLFFNCMAVVYAANDFTDVKSTNWAYESVKAMSEKGILKGYADGTFKPNNNVTYGEFIKMALIGATNQDVGNSSTGNWAMSYYEQAVDMELFTPQEISYKKIKEEITREDMAFIISRILGEKQIDNYDFINEKISDVNSNSKYNTDIIKVFSLGILTGYSDGTFKPEGTLTRAEAVTVIYRLVDESKRIDVEKLKNNFEQQKEIKNPMTITSGGNEIIVDKETVSLPFHDIDSIQIPSGKNWIQVKSKSAQGFMLYVDNDFIGAVGNADGTDYFYRDGYYFYYFNPYDLNLKEKNVYLRFSVDENEKIYLIEGVNL